MFDSVDQRMKRDVPSRGERLVKCILITASSVLVFGGLYLMLLNP